MTFKTDAPSVAGEELWMLVAGDRRHRAVVYQGEIVSVTPYVEELIGMTVLDAHAWLHERALPYGGNPFDVRSQ